MDHTDARARLEKLLAEIDASTGTLEGQDAGRSDELSTVDQHPADNATDLADAERESATLGVLAGQRAEVVAALGRLDAGTYGRCVDCGRDLPAERLEARPEAARCVTDQAKVEASP